MVDQDASLVKATWALGTSEEEGGSKRRWDGHSRGEDTFVNHVVSCIWYNYCGWVMVEAGTPTNLPILYGFKS